ncbi:hypothetical protein TNCV_1019091 [Trichonephila clavipes]|nr:hypothetical protein TNCV_1019091 [Trichonephila clavipes]
MRSPSSVTTVTTVTISGHMAREASLHPISEKYKRNDCGLYPASIKEIHRRWLVTRESDNNEKKVRNKKRTVSESPGFREKKTK